MKTIPYINLNFKTNTIAARVEEYSVYIKWSNHWQTEEQVLIFIVVPHVKPFPDSFKGQSSVSFSNVCLDIPVIS